ncbi:hypothetical protein BCV69DRAFT_282469 [Microstroma glucosiphilum]|uniref:Uncharacterized protein n=1 Tax=Pseudomicrostroma glucosiphilum TaxID=1684307 RepID=A0A316U9A5_9BASI|nr:hypothetical protein BCV69DRAFT_282469 [Pseudomicrostroma glucosiphilum]PWN20963.1 hypothetical protein BCV69DRAFT_282469 [Pseudomicrostroma glucosiphilum]
MVACPLSSQALQPGASSSWLSAPHQAAAEAAMKPQVAQVPQAQETTPVASLSLSNVAVQVQGTTSLNEHSDSYARVSGFGTATTDAGPSNFSTPLRRFSSADTSSSTMLPAQVQAGSDWQLSRDGPTPECTPTENSEAGHTSQRRRRSSKQHKQQRRLSESPSPCPSRRPSYQAEAGGNKRQRTPASSSSRHPSLPVKLPQPDIVILSDPYKDLTGHLRRHGLFAEAQAFAEAGVPANYVLHGYMTAATGGPPALLEQTSRLLVKHGQEVARQMAKSKLDHTTRNVASALPECLTFDIESLDAQAEENGLTPTHVFALHSSMPAEGRNGTASPASSNGMLVPIHALAYVLQCVSLPALPSASACPAASTTGMRDMPVVPLRIPCPQAFPVMHRFIYNHNATELLCSLLPIRHITTTLNRSSSPFGVPTLGADATTLPKHFTVTRAVQILSELPVSELLGHAKQVHACWANGIAVGLLSHLYWSTLDRAWDMIVGAMTLKRGRQVLEQEMERTLLRDREASADVSAPSSA